MARRAAGRRIPDAPPLAGAWPETLAQAHWQRMAEVYAQQPPGYVLPPELAALGYEPEPELLKLVTDHVDRMHRAQDGPRDEKRVADLGIRPVGFVHFNRLWLNSLSQSPSTDSVCSWVPAASTGSSVAVSAALLADVCRRSVLIVQPKMRRAACGRRDTIRCHGRQKW
ncbi:hypothetical protein [Streptomyces sp. NBC_00572]|uniref:hypothetical protein n=1 Tax=Streptomyces sp. NBC_00572 TaxID=2903664 RepID=UPI00224EA945|nr:hypothetical protein [Streptomyces sp. NBC_00572]MCX4985975.1 hypothetical protein [Streptomyces sp. NBC_00572]